MYNLKEVAKFEKIANEWWMRGGGFDTLHTISEVRMQYLVDMLTKQFGKVKGLRILDIGCGGGLISIPLARLGANVLGIDAGGKNIDAAQEAANNMLKNVHDIQLEFRNITSVQLIAESTDKFDAVVCLEVLEHVDNIADIIQDISKILNDDGIAIFSTLNRTCKARAFGIWAAEYILGMVPRGTHDYKKFIKPYELSQCVEKYGMKTIDIKGMKYFPLSRKFMLDDDTSINYFMTVRII